MAQFNEKKLQKFIAENPWLINQNYESIPELENLGQEYQIGDMKRIDLILRDRINKTPVIVEFKAIPFYRENIGQILEYRARVVSMMSKREDALYEIFKEYISCPRLVLVVEECDDFSRISCNMSGIDVVEFKNESLSLTDPEKVRSIKNFTETYKKDPYPLSLKRYENIDKNVYKPIREYLKERNIDYDWVEPRYRDVFYYNQYPQMFINRWLFSDEVDYVSFGIYEDILDMDCPVYFAFYSTDKQVLSKFSEKYNKKYKEKCEMKWNDSESEGSLVKSYDKGTFFQNTVKIINSELNRYFEIKALWNNDD